MRCFEFLGELEVRSAWRFTGGPVLTDPGGKEFTCRRKFACFCVQGQTKMLYFIAFSASLAPSSSDRSHLRWPERAQFF